MNERFNKPRVFLSHARSDSDFIERLSIDLRKCQIEPWLDVEEIRHGKPWLDSIFEDGIPTCDCVLVYLTKHSLASTMVKKELDAAVLEQLLDKKVVLLPYVESEELRGDLRADIRALQVPALNPENYQSLLPKIVAEIWRSFLERSVLIAVQQERVKRLEAELEVEKLRKSVGDGVFSESEDQNFTYIYERINRQVVVEAQEYKRNGNISVKFQSIPVSVSLLSILPLISHSKCNEFCFAHLHSAVSQGLKVFFSGCEPTDPLSHISVSGLPEITDELLMFGFIQKVSFNRTNTRGNFDLTHRLVYTDRIERFKYWLAFKGLLPKELIYEILPTIENNSTAERTTET